MGSKENPDKFDCYTNALPDEPMFILLGRDPAGPDLVNDWADIREAQIGNGSRPASDKAMVESARQCAENMRAWRKANDGKWRK